MKALRRIAIAVVGLVVTLVGVFSFSWLAAHETIGELPAGERLARVQQSTHWRDGRFRNALTRVDGPLTESVLRWLFGGGSPYASPEAPLVVQQRARAQFDTLPASGLRVTWLGHSTTLIELDGQRVLTDQMWGTRASPLSWIGPARFFSPPLALDDLPQIDAVVISHDHYDHLDMGTVRTLSAMGTRFIVPLGIGARLASWDVPAAQITELDWWQDVTVGSLTITATPSRHFSGRWVHDADRTLWAGWSIASPTARVYYSGDTALLDDMEAIGARLGPFDIALIEIGAYNALWSDVHLGPEQAVRASRLVRAAVLLPVHWATFDLALHGWTEPIERTLVAAAREGVRVATPVPGGSVEPLRTLPDRKWWPQLPWQRVEQAPAFSTSVNALWERTTPHQPLPGQP